jgi:Fe-S-cluster containining protein
MGEEVAFECARCGRCCNQRLILLNTEDVFRMAEHLQMTVPQFMEKYGVVFAKAGDNRTPRLYLQINSDRCPFFSDGCIIHAFKPLICRMFPTLKPGQTAGEIKAFINKHATSEGVKSCKLFSLPDETILAADREAMITSVIYDSAETIYYANLERTDMKFIYNLLRAVNRQQLRTIVADYLFNGSTESGLIFEQAMFEIQAMCKVIDWHKVPYIVVNDGATFEPGLVRVYVSPQDARDIYEASTDGQIEAVFSQANPSIADPSFAFVSVAIRTPGAQGMMLAFMGKKDELQSVSADGRAMLAFCPSDGSMDQVAAMSIFIDTEVTKDTANPAP